MLGLVERPWRAERRFKRAIRSSSKSRTCRFPGIVSLDALGRRFVSTAKVAMSRTSTAEAAHPRPMHRNLAAVEADHALGRAQRWPPASARGCAARR